MIVVVKADDLIGGIDSLPGIYENKKLELATGESEVLISEGAWASTYFIKTTKVTGDGHTIKVVADGVTLFEIPITEQPNRIPFILAEDINKLSVEVTGGTGKATLFGFELEEGEWETEKVTLMPTVLKETRRKNLDGWEMEVELRIEDNKHIEEGFIVLAETKESGIQPFRIMNPLVNKSKVSFIAYHIMFDTKDYIIPEFRRESASAAAIVTVANESTDSESPYTIFSNVDTLIDVDYFGPSLLEVLKDVILKAQCNIEADWWDIKVTDDQGFDTGEVIAYAKNSANFQYSTNFDNVVTTIFPYFQLSEELRFILPETYIKSDVRYNKKYSKTVQFTPRVEVYKPKEEGQDEADLNTDALIADLRGQASDYVRRFQFPLTGLKISSHLNLDARIGDTVHFKHPDITPDVPLVGTSVGPVSIPIEVYAYEYMPLTKSLASITYGDFETTSYDRLKKLAQGVVNENLNNERPRDLDIKNAIDILNQIQDNIKKELIQNQADLNEQAELINNLNKKGHIIIYDNEILAVDTLPAELATNVLKIGVGGITASKTGIDGPFDLAIGIDGTINANKITAGELNGSIIKTNTIMSDALSIEAQQFIVNLTKQGGGNYIKNSVFLAGSRYWDLTTSAVTTIGQSVSSWVLRGTAGSGIQLTSTGSGIALATQKIHAINGELFTFSFKIKQTDMSTTTKVCVSEITEQGYYDENYAPAIKTHEKSFTGPVDGEQVLSFIPESQFLRVEIHYSAASAGTPITTEITDLMLDKGKSQNWTSSRDEIYGADVQFDTQGIRVIRRNPNTNAETGYTIMSPSEFAGYYNGKRIFTLNQDITEVSGLSIESKGLYMPPVKIVQNRGATPSWDIVWTG